MGRFLRWLGIILTIVLVLVLAPIFGIGYFLSPQSPLSHTDAIVAISGGDTQARAREAIKLYQDGYANLLIFSGAALDQAGPSNAKAMEEQAVAAGIDPSRIVIDEASATTAQNADGVAQIVRSRGFTSIILVTSPYHQRRAYITFGRALGPSVKILNHSAIDQNWRRSRWWANPTAYGLTLAELEKTIFVIVTGSKG